MWSNKLFLLILLTSLWRIGLFVTAAIAPRVLSPFKESFPYSELLVATGLPWWLWSWGNFDGVHYIGIAQTQYGAYFTQAFFPLYPLLMAITGNVLFFLHDPWSRFVVAGIFISSVSLIGVLWLFGKLTKDVSMSYRTIGALLLFPTAFYLGAVYSESLFLLLVLLFFYFLKEGKFWKGALVCGLGTATRFVGVGLILSLWFEYFRRYRKHWNWAHGVRLGTLTLLGLSGLILYSLYLEVRFDDPLLFAHVQGAFGAARTSQAIVTLPQVFFRYGKILLTVPWNTYPFFTSLLELFATLTGIIGLIFAWKKKVPISYLLFSIVALLTPTLTGSLTSMPRYVLVAFPLYFVIAHLPTIWYRVWIGISALLLIILTMLFVRGYWVA